MSTKPRKLVVTFNYDGPRGVGYPLQRSWPVTFTTETLERGFRHVAKRIEQHEDGPFLLHITTLSGDVVLFCDKTLALEVSDYADDEICPKCFSLNLGWKDLPMARGRFCEDCGHEFEEEMG